MKKFFVVFFITFTGILNASLESYCDLSIGESFKSVSNKYKLEKHQEEGEYKVLTKLPLVDSRFLTFSNNVLIKILDVIPHESDVINTISMQNLEKHFKENPKRVAIQPSILDEYGEDIIIFTGYSDLYLSYEITFFNYYIVNEKTGVFKRIKTVFTVEGKGDAI